MDTSELMSLRTSGRILSESLRAVVAALRKGASGKELDSIAETSIRSRGGIPSFKGYQGYPASLCISINDEVVHGIPRPDRILQETVVSLDLGVRYHGMHTDMATTVAVGKQAPDVTKLIATTRNALAEGLAAVRAGATTGDIGAAVQRVVESGGFGVVRDLVGHGVGRRIHEEPAIPNFGRPHTGTPLVAGMALAIEPMVTVGSYGVTTDADGWTVRTADGSIATHEERTVVVTQDGFELITPWDYGTSDRN